METPPRPAGPNHKETGRLRSPDPGAAIAPVNKWTKVPVEKEGATRLTWRFSTPAPMETIIAQVIEVLREAEGQRIRLDDLPKAYNRKFGNCPPALIAGAENDPLLLQAVRSAPFNTLLKLEHDNSLQAVVNAETSVLNAEVGLKNVEKEANEGPPPTEAGDENAASINKEEEGKDVLGQGQLGSGIDAHGAPSSVDPAQVAEAANGGAVSMPTPDASADAVTALPSADVRASDASPTASTSSVRPVAYLRLLPAGLQLSQDELNALKLPPYTSEPTSPTPSPLKLLNIGQSGAQESRGVHDKAATSEPMGLRESIAGMGPGVERDKEGIDRVTASLQDRLSDLLSSTEGFLPGHGQSDNARHGDLVSAEGLLSDINGESLTTQADPVRFSPPPTDSQNPHKEYDEDQKDDNGRAASLLAPLIDALSEHEEEEGMSLAAATVEGILSDDENDTTRSSSSPPLISRNGENAQEQQEGMSRATATIEGFLSDKDEEKETTFSQSQHTTQSTPSPPSTAAFLAPPPGFEHLAFLPSTPSSLLSDPSAYEVQSAFRPSEYESSLLEAGGGGFSPREGFNASGLGVIDVPALGAHAAQGFAPTHLQNETGAGQASATEAEGTGERAEPTPEAVFCWQLVQVLRSQKIGPPINIINLRKHFEKLHGHVPHLPGSPNPGLQHIQAFLRASYPSTKFIHLADDMLNLSLTYEGRRVSEAEVLFPPPNPNPPQPPINAEPLKASARAMPEPSPPIHRRPTMAEQPPKDNAHPLRRGNARDRRRDGDRRDETREQRKRDEASGSASLHPPVAVAEPSSKAADASPFTYLPLPLSPSANASPLPSPWIPLDLTELGLGPAPLPVPLSHNATQPQRKGKPNPPPAQAAKAESSGYLPLPDGFNPADPFPFSSAAEPRKERKKDQQPRTSAPSTSPTKPVRQTAGGKQKDNQPKEAQVPLSERIRNRKAVHEPPAPPPAPATSPLLHTSLSSAALLHKHLPPQLHSPCSFLLLSSPSDLLLLLFPSSSPPLSFLLPRALTLPLLTLSGMRALLSTQKPIHKLTFDLYSNSSWVHATDGLSMPSLIDLQLATEITLDSPADTAVATSSSSSSATATSTQTAALTEPPRWVTDVCDLALLWADNATTHSPKEMERVKQATAKRLAIVREHERGQGEVGMWLQQGFRPRVFAPAKHRMVSLEAWEVGFGHTAETESEGTQANLGPVQVHDDTQALLDFLPADLSLPPLSSLLPSPPPTIELILPLNQPPRYRLHPSLPSPTKAPLQSLHSDPTVLVTLDHLNSQLPSRLPPLPSSTLYPRLSIPNTLHRVSLIRSENGVIVSATIRSGRFVTGQLPAFADLLHPPSSLLLLGPRGCGKTTLLREIAGHLSLTAEVIVIDALGEVGGDGDLMHHSLQRARRMAGAEVGKQARLITDAGIRHTADVVVIDEISSEEELAAISSLRQRGVTVIAGIQAESHESFCKHHEVGRTIAKDSAKHKAKSPIVDSLITCHASTHHKWTVHPSSGPSQTRHLDPSTGIVYVLPPPPPTTQA